METRTVYNVYIYVYDRNQLSQSLVVGRGTATLLCFWTDSDQQAEFSIFIRGLSSCWDCPDDHQHQSGDKTLKCSRLLSAYKIQPSLRVSSVLGLRHKPGISFQAAAEGRHRHQQDHQVWNGSARSGALREN